MTTLAIKKSEKKILVELNRDTLETLMAAMGVLSSPALESIRRAEEDYRKGNFRILKNPKGLLHKTVRK